MRKHTMAKILVAAAAMATLITTTGFGQMESRITFTVPFAFRVSGTILQAGDYAVTPNTANGVLFLKAADGKQGAFVRYETSKNPGDKACDYGLTFEKIGSTYLLTALWEPSGIANVRLPKLDGQMLLEARNRKAAPATTVMASRR